MTKPKTVFGCLRNDDDESCCRCCCCCCRVWFNGKSSSSVKPQDVDDTVEKEERISLVRSMWELYSTRCSDDGMISVDVIRPLLNSIGLYPTHSQVYELVHCACEYAGRKTATDQITFGEFCVLVSELREHYRKNLPNPAPRSQLRVKAIQQAFEEKNCKRKFLVFLGGSCNPTTWREDEAIPFFKDQKISFFNPQVNNWKPELIEIEEDAKQTAELLFFVIDNQTRSTSSMVEVAYLAGCGRQVVLVMRNFQLPVIINGERLKQSELEDLERSHRYLVDLVERMSLPVFYELNEALTCTKTVLYQNKRVNELTESEGARPVKHPHIRVASELIRMRKIFNTLSTSGSSTLDYDDVLHAYRTVTDEELPIELFERRGVQSSPPCSQPATPLTVVLPPLHHEDKYSFDDFCCIVAEHRYRKRAVTERLVTGLARLPSRLASWFRGSGSQLSEMSRGGTRTWDVFLGGSCGATQWREEIAIPALLRGGVSYYNPQMEQWNTHYISLESAVKHSCRLLLFIITCDTRAVMSMLEAAFYIGHSCNTVICVQDLKKGLVIDGEQMSDSAVADYNRARAYLRDLANRNGVPVLTDIREAIMCAVQRLHDQYGVSNNNNISSSSPPLSQSSSTSDSP